MADSSAFRLRSHGAVASRPIVSETIIGVFAYYAWDFVGIVTKDLGIGVVHKEIGANCDLRNDRSDPCTILLCATRSIPSGDVLSIDYTHVPWWIRRPPQPLLLASRDICTPRYYVSPSPRPSGHSTYAATRIARNARVGACIRYEWWIIPVVTRELGIYINHSKSPTARLEWIDWSYGWAVVTNFELAPHDEITLNFATLPWYCKSQDH